MLSILNRAPEILTVEPHYNMLEILSAFAATSGKPVPYESGPCGAGNLSERSVEPSMAETGIQLDADRLRADLGVGSR